MKFEKLMQSISLIEEKYLDLITTMINEFLQEIMDPEDFYDNGPRDISTQQLLDDIANKAHKHIASMLMICAVEFCITNYYPFEDLEWNFIKHFLKYHKNRLTTKEQKYLQSLNNSYMSIYKIISVSPGKSVILQDKIEKKSPKITVIDKAFSKSAKRGESIAARVLEKTTRNKPTEYQLACSIFAMPDPIIKDCTNIIRNIIDAMSNPLAMQLLGNNEIIEDNDHNKLLAKKMWSKEIAENIYLYYSNYTDYHDILDCDGNPWSPCIIEFDLISSTKRVKQVLSSIKEFKLDEEDKSSNTWLWLDKKYNKLNAQNLKKTLPANDNKKKYPIYNGTFITNEYDRQAYHIFAEIKLSKNKLMIDVNSKQHANIAQDKILTELKEMVSNPMIKLQS